MKILFPKYYEKFGCIADKCKHSCCVGWEIDVDEATVMKYSAMEGELGEEIRSHISGDPAVIQLLNDERCPFLDECGLCRIISALGEESVSAICRQHPRFYYNVRGKIEGGIGAVCEEACRIILSSEDYEEQIEVEADVDVPPESSFDTLAHRKFLYSLLFEGTHTHDEIIRLIRNKYNLPNPIDRAGEWNDLLSELEYLNESHRDAFSIGKRDDRVELHRYFDRFLAYLVYRHVSTAENYENLRARVGFCLLMVLLLENITAERDVSFEDVVEAVRGISEEIEYSEDNTAELIFEMESII